MSEFYIELSESPADRLYLKPSQVDLTCYDNNRGYEVFALAFCDGGEVFLEMDFPSKEARDDYAEANGIDIVNEEWHYDVCSWEITRDNGTWYETFPCRCDVLVGYCNA